MYAVAPGDQRFVMLDFANFGNGNIAMIQNWVGSLQGRLPR